MEVQSVLFVYEVYVHRDEIASDALGILCNMLSNGSTYQPDFVHIVVLTTLNIRTKIFFWRKLDALTNNQNFTVKILKSN